MTDLAKLAYEHVHQIAWRGVLPNGVRLSCGAELESSQMKVYHDVGRRQLQALVRRRTNQRGSSTNTS